MFRLSFVLVALLAVVFASPAATLASPVPGLPGRVLVSCRASASSPTSDDVYELSAGALIRRTTSRPGFGVVDFAVGAGQIALVRPSLTVERVELAPLSGERYRGPVFADGGTPAFGADGRLAWTTLVERPNGHLGDAIYVRRPGVSRRRIATFAYVWEQQFIGRRLFAFVTVGGKLYEVRDVGTPRARMTPLQMQRPARVAWSNSGRLAYSDRGRQRIRVLTPAGHEQASYPSDEVPLAWSPDGRSLLATSSRGLALIDPDTGTPTELGPLPCGTVITARWIST